MATLWRHPRNFGTSPLERGGLVETVRARDLLDIAEQIKEAEAGLRALSESSADTTSSAGRMVLTVFAGIAEFERALSHQRGVAGLASRMTA